MSTAPALQPDESGLRLKPQLDPLANFIGGSAEKISKTKAPKKTDPGARRKQYVEEMEERIKRQDWKNLSAGQLVAVYWVCHLKIYGVPPKELDSTSNYSRAMMMAAKLVKDEFAGDVDLAVDFMRWAWFREKDREDWRKRNNTSGRRITWYLQFVAKDLLTDWQREKFRRGA